MAASKPKLKSKPTVCSDKLRSLILESDSCMVLGKDLQRGILTIKNRGPGKIIVQNGYGPDKAVEIQPGHVRLVPTYNTIELENKDKLSAAIEFGFMLALKPY